MTTNTKIAGEDMQITDEQIEDALAAAGIDFYSTGTIAGTADDLFAGVRALLASKPAVPAFDDAWLMGVVRSVQPNAVRIPPGIRAIANAILAASPTAPAQSCGEPGMTNGDFHCPACGSVMKGPTACGSCLWESDTCGYVATAQSCGDAEQADEAGNDALGDAPHPSIARAITQEERACRAEDALIDLVNQICKSDPVDDHGHDFKLNRAYIEAQKLLDAARAKDSK